MNKERKPKSIYSAKLVIRRSLPDAYCVRLMDNTGYIVWPGKIQPRGFERPACGYGKTARQAWESVKLGTTNNE